MLNVNKRKKIHIHDTPCTENVSCFICLIDSLIDSLNDSLIRTSCRTLCLERKNGKVNLKEERERGTKHLQKYVDLCMFLMNLIGFSFIDPKLGN